MDVDADAPADPDDLLQWRRDATTSRAIRLLWSLGVGTFFAVITIIVFWRLYDLTGQIGGQSIVVALFAAILVTIFALVVSDNTGSHLERLPFSTPSGPALQRAADAALGAIAMGAIIVTLMGIGRYVSQNNLLGDLGAGPFTGLAALTIPLALGALVCSSFLESVGAFDPDEGVIYLYEPEQAIDLSVIRTVSTRPVGDAVVVTLDYAQPGGQYVAGPRRIVVPPAIAAEIESYVERNSSAPEA
ncbi:hypothetical protein [Halopiger aswanensis]|uniref:Uncharacterized protein n=1 Tax=Halopiger aswanensis TaxID=148449 RepID=A0A419WET3_9EURY|nr:hypothetical protein [Halopiger aswanensis]RKD93953.1 hypothetical protein ATJ93_3588 [Halopiger aswanensis]